MKLLLPIAFVIAGSVSASDSVAGTIKGKVSFEGEAEPLPALKIDEAAAKGCVASGSVDTTDRSVRIDKNGGVADVVVTVSVKGMELEVPSEPIVLDQKGCRFSSSVVVVPEGATVRYANSDGLNHNVHTYAVKNKAVNSNIPGGSFEEQELGKAEDFDVKCDIHPWMQTKIFVTDDPVYGVSAADGTFTLTGVPAGTYKVNYWHAKLGKGKSEEVTVTAGAEAALEIKLGGDDGKKKKGRGRRGR